MLSLRTLGLVAAAGVLLAACGGGNSSDGEGDDPVNALGTAMTFVGVESDATPTIGETYDCTIIPKRQPTPPANQLLPVDARCLWNVEKQGTAWLVKYQETWFCQDWAAVAQGYPDCDSITGHHEREFLVDLDNGTVDQLSSRGQFPPDM